MRQKKQVNDAIEQRMSCESAQKVSASGGDERYDIAQRAQTNSVTNDPGEPKTFVQGPHLSRSLEKVTSLLATQFVERRDSIALHPGKGRFAEISPHEVDWQWDEVKGSSSNPSPSKPREASLSCTPFSLPPLRDLGEGSGLGTSPIPKSGVREEQARHNATSELIVNDDRPVEVIVRRHGDHSKRKLSSLGYNVESDPNGLLKQQDVQYVSSEKRVGTVAIVTRPTKDRTSTPPDTTTSTESTQITPGALDIHRGLGDRAPIDTAEASALQRQDSGGATNAGGSQEDEAMSGKEKGQVNEWLTLVLMKVRNADVFSVSGSEVVQGFRRELPNGDDENMHVFTQDAYIFLYKDMRGRKLWALTVGMWSFRIGR